MYHSIADFTLHKQQARMQTVYCFGHVQTTAHSSDEHDNTQNRRNDSTGFRGASAAAAAAAALRVVVPGAASGRVTLHSRPQSAPAPTGDDASPTSTRPEPAAALLATRVPPHPHNGSNDFLRHVSRATALPVDTTALHVTTALAGAEDDAPRPRKSTSQIPPPVKVSPRGAAAGGGSASSSASSLLSPGRLVFEMGLATARSAEGGIDTHRHVAGLALGGADEEELLAHDADVVDAPPMPQVLTRATLGQVAAAASAVVPSRGGGAGAGGASVHEESVAAANASSSSGGDGGAPESARQQAAAAELREAAAAALALAEQLQLEDASVVPCSAEAASQLGEYSGSHEAAAPPRRFLLTPPPQSEKQVLLGRHREADADAHAAAIDDDTHLGLRAPLDASPELMDTYRARLATVEAQSRSELLAFTSGYAGLLQRQATPPVSHSGAQAPPTATLPSVQEQHGIERLENVTSVTAVTADETATAAQPSPGQPHVLSPLSVTVDVLAPGAAAAPMTGIELRFAQWRAAQEQQQHPPYTGDVAAPISGGDAGNDSRESSVLASTTTLAARFGLRMPPVLQQQARPVATARRLLQPRGALNAPTSMAAAAAPASAASDSASDGSVDAVAWPARQHTPKSATAATSDEPVTASTDSGPSTSTPVRATTVSEPNSMSQPELPFSPSMLIVGASTTMQLPLVAGGAGPFSPPVARRRADAETGRTGAGNDGATEVDVGDVEDGGRRRRVDRAIRDVALPPAQTSFVTGVDGRSSDAPARDAASPTTAAAAVEVAERVLHLATRALAELEVARAEGVAESADAVLRLRRAVAAMPGGASAVAEAAAATSWPALPLARASRLELAEGDDSRVAPLALASSARVGGVAAHPLSYAAFAAAARGGATVPLPSPSADMTPRPQRANATPQQQQQQQQQPSVYASLAAAAARDSYFEAAAGDDERAEVVGDASATTAAGSSTSSHQDRRWRVRAAPADALDVSRRRRDMPPPPPPPRGVHRTAAKSSDPPPPLQLRSLPPMTAPETETGIPLQQLLQLQQLPAAASGPALMLEPPPQPAPSVSPSSLQQQARHQRGSRGAAAASASSPPRPYCSRSLSPSAMRRSPSTSPTRQSPTPFRDTWLAVYPNSASAGVSAATGADSATGTAAAPPPRLAPAIAQPPPPQRIGQPAPQLAAPVAQAQTDKPGRHARGGIAPSPSDRATPQADTAAWRSAAASIASSSAAVSLHRALAEAAVMGESLPAYVPSMREGAVDGSFAGSSSLQSMSSSLRPRDTIRNPQASLRAALVGVLSPTLGGAPGGMLYHSLGSASVGRPRLTPRHERF